jgi:hypothetical protein
MMAEDNESCNYYVLRIYTGPKYCGTSDIGVPLSIDPYEGYVSRGKEIADLQASNRILRAALEEIRDHEHGAIGTFPNDPRVIGHIDGHRCCAAIAARGLKEAGE